MRSAICFSLALLLGCGSDNATAPAPVDPIVGQWCAEAATGGFETLVWSDFREDGTYHRTQLLLERGAGPIAELSVGDQLYREAGLWGWEVDDTYWLSRRAGESYGNGDLDPYLRTVDILIRGGHLDMWGDTHTPCSLADRQAILEDHGDG